METRQIGRLNAVRAVERRRVMAKALVTWAAAIAAAVAAFGMPAQSGHDLFQQALVKERAEGNLQEAIDLYDRIVRDFPEDHALAAKSLVQMGQCYEKLGQQGARKAYERVIRDYSDQAEPLQVARARLAALTRPPRHEMTVRRVWSGPHADTGGEISPDGGYLSFVDWDTGDLAVRDLTTGKNRRLTNKGPWTDSQEFALYSRWSPDGKKIAYDWYAGTDDRCNELRVVDIENAQSRLLYDPGEESCVILVDWSPDGREILFVVGSDSKKLLQLAAISAADGTVRIIKGRDRRYPADTLAGFSPDGRHILCSQPSGKDSVSADVFVLSSDGQSETRLVDHPANDLAAGWSPDGKWVLFVSDRTGTLDLWMIPVDDGKPSGEPRLVKSGTGRIWPLGFDSGGRYYYGTGSRGGDIYTITLDPMTGRVLSAPSRAIKRFQGSNEWPSYSRDGAFLAYVSGRGSLTGPRARAGVLCIHSLESGKEREFATDFRRLADPRFSPDGTTVFVAAWDDENRTGIYRVDTTTGDFSPVVEAGEGSRFCAHAVAPDGTALFYSRCDDADKACRIVKRDLASGSDTEMYRGPDERPSIALSPDGRTLAFITVPREPDSERVVRVVPAAGGAPREIYRFRHFGAGWITLEFSADGKSLFIPRKLTPPEDPYWTLFSVPVEGGEPQDLGVKMVSFAKVTAHPDGERIAFASRGAEEKGDEVWVIEDFLPRATGRP
jgi:Tol biopolymer transport system component